jgi:hypothetical protein
MQSRRQPAVSAKHGCRHINPFWALTAAPRSAGARAQIKAFCAPASRVAYLMIHQLEINRHYCAGRRITRLSRMAQSRHVHRLDRKEYQSHARAAVPTRFPLYMLDSVDDDRKQTIYEFRFRRSEHNLNDTGRPQANPGLAFGRSVRRLGTC